MSHGGHHTTRLWRTSRWIFKDRLLLPAQSGRTIRCCCGSLQQPLGKLTDIHNDLVERSVNTDLAVVDSAEKRKLLEACGSMQDWQIDINSSLENATDEHLSAYAEQIRNVTLFAIELCRKHRIYDDIESFGYNEPESMVELNGESLYFLG